ncbi:MULTISPECIES: hypothetical protein [unclassified Spiroplasma]|uniref:hypothetical protein n=1 Tax=unclassified Spiroplasma TaxID=2637901 RepID=UPI0012EADBCB|nr:MULTISPECIES: hypothetical protein [unclassified Spiroplasma]
MLERFKDIESILTKNNFISKNQIALKGSVKTKTVTFKRRLNDNDLDISIKYFENKLNLEKFKKIKADIFIFLKKNIRKGEEVENKNRSMQIIGKNQFKVDIVPIFSVGDSDYIFKDYDNLEETYDEKLFNKINSKYNNINFFKFVYIIRNIINKIAKILNMPLQAIMLDILEEEKDFYDLLEISQFHKMLFLISKKIWDMYNLDTKIYQNKEGFSFKLKNSADNKKTCKNYISYLIHVDEYAQKWYELCNKKLEYKKALEIEEYLNKKEQEYSK